ncbi:MAG: hypothetical protein U0526_00900 [Candidatus Saccharibacteria bacterium]
MHQASQHMVLLVVKQLQGFPLSIDVSTYLPNTPEMDGISLCQWQIQDWPALEWQFIEEAIAETYPTPMLHTWLVPLDELEEQLFFKLRELYYEDHPTAALVPQSANSPINDLSLMSRAIIVKVNQRMRDWHDLASAGGRE